MILVYQNGMRTSNKYEKWFILSDFDTNAENKNWSED